MDGIGDIPRSVAEGTLAVAVRGSKLLGPIQRPSSDADSNSRTLSTIVVDGCSDSSRSRMADSKAVNPGSSGNNDHGSDSLGFASWIGCRHHAERRGLPRACSLRWRGVATSDAPFLTAS